MKIDIRKFFYKHLEIFVLLLTAIISVSAMIFYYTNNLTLEYNDATSHLNIARRITDSLTPGLVQIGSNWLPLLHLLELPFTLNFSLWQSGLAGSIISMMSFLFSSLAIFKIVEQITRDKLSGFIGALVFILNANILYMQTTAMFEPLLIATSMGGIYYLIKWSQEQKLSQLLFGAFFIFLSSLTRYDGWFLFLCSIPVVFLISIRKRNYKYAEGRTIMFMVLSSLGIVLWFIYNKIIFGSATYFMSSEFSARGQQVIWEELGKLPAKGSIFLAFWTYIRTVIYNTGFLPFLLSILGLISFFFTKRSIVMKISFVLLLFIPLIFHVISLYIGHSIIWLPDVAPYDSSFFNVRYGLVMVPTIAILIGVLTMNKKYLKFVIILLVLLQSILFYFDNNGQLNIKNITVMKDTKAGNSESGNKTAQWIRNNCKDGLTLISSAGYEAVIFRTGLSLNHFITEGTGKYWRTSLIKPSTYAECIMLGSSWLNKINVSMENNIDFDRNYKKVESFGSFQMFKRNNLIYEK
ncbi:MAG: hypothetical protein AAB788_04405 [Patescibacteria group bacterium]